MTPLLAAEAVWKSYGGTDVLKGVDLCVAPGECLVLIGPSGSGKSTLLRCLNLLEPVGSGRVVFEGRDIAGMTGRAAQGVRRRIGMVFQNFVSVAAWPFFQGGCWVWLVCLRQGASS